MSDITFELLKIVIMIVAVVVARYLIPCLNTIKDSERMAEVQGWVEQTVFMVQQVFGAESGEERKKIAVSIISEILDEKGIKISDEQIDLLIEAAVKQMKIAEGR